VQRTGDLAIRDDAGMIHFRGRRDRQVKVLGVRIELGEVEAVIGRHPDVQRVTVVTRKDVVGGTDELLGSGGSGGGGGGGRGAYNGSLLATDDVHGSSLDATLVAYVDSKAWVYTLSSEVLEPRRVVNDLRAFCRAHMPEGQVPSLFVLMRPNDWTLTGSGKVDQRALPRPNADGSQPSERERALAKSHSKLHGDNIGQGGVGSGSGMGMGMGMGGGMDNDGNDSVVSDMVDSDDDCVGGGAKRGGNDTDCMASRKGGGVPCFSPKRGRTGRGSASVHGTALDAVLLAAEATTGYVVNASTPLAVVYTNVVGGPSLGAFIRILEHTLGYTLRGGWGEESEEKDGGGTGTGHGEGSRVLSESVLSESAIWQYETVGDLADALASPATKAATGGGDEAANAAAKGGGGGGGGAGVQGAGSSSSLGSGLSSLMGLRGVLAILVYYSDYLGYYVGARGAEHYLQNRVEEASVLMVLIGVMTVLHLRLLPRSQTHLSVSNVVRFYKTQLATILPVVWVGLALNIAYVVCVGCVFMCKGGAAQGRLGVQNFPPAVHFVNQTVYLNEGGPAFYLRDALVQTPMYVLGLQAWLPGTLMLTHLWLVTALVTFILVAPFAEAIMRHTRSVGAAVGGICGSLGVIFLMTVVSRLIHLYLQNNDPDQDPLPYVEGKRR
jgi:hypothetical protein